MNSLFKTHLQKLADERESHIRPEIRALVERGNVTPAEVAELRCNSWEWEALVPVLTDEAFLQRMQHALNNCFTTRERPFSTYNQAVEGLYAPELIRRFRAQLSHDQMKQACKNIGFDLSCGACAELFFTGVRLHPHDETCFTHNNSAESAAKSYAETIDNVRDALGQEATHYFVIADDVKELVQAVEKYGGPALEVLQKLRATPGSGNPAATPGHPHIINGEFQSDKYPTTPRGKVPLSTKDPQAQDLLWEYARRHREIDPQFSDDLEFALRVKGYVPVEENAARMIPRKADES